jgi:hypothetical protein
VKVSEKRSREKRVRRRCVRAQVNAAVRTEERNVGTGTISRIYPVSDTYYHKNQKM